MFRAVEASAADEEVHFYTSSGGNAGLACITAANTLGRPATVVVPLTTLPHMVAKLRALGADVQQVGESWAFADQHLREVVIPAFERAHRDKGARAVYVAPFDHPDVWDGAETMVDEMAAQVVGTGEDEKLPGGAAPPAIDGVVCSVGGGGLLCGVMQGVQKLPAAGRGRGPVVVVAVETAGGDSLNASVRAGELVTLPAITTVATSLGATRVAAEAFAWTRRAGGEGLVSVVVSDADAVRAVARFLDDERLLVETACGATIAAVYDGTLRRHLGEGLNDEEWAKKNVVVVVCGGSNINLSMLEKYKKDFGV